MTVMEKGMQIQTLDCKFLSQRHNCLDCYSHHIEQFVHWTRGDAEYRWAELIELTEPWWPNYFQSNLEVFLQPTIALRTLQIREFHFSLHSVEQIAKWKLFCAVTVKSVLTWQKIASTMVSFSEESNSFHQLNRSSSDVDGASVIRISIRSNATNLKILKKWVIIMNQFRAPLHRLPKLYVRK